MGGSADVQVSESETVLSCGRQEKVFGIPSSCRLYPVLLRADAQHADACICKYLNYNRSAALSVIMFVLCAISAGVYIYTNLKEQEWER